MRGMKGLPRRRTGGPGRGGGIGGWTLASGNGKLLAKTLRNASSGAALFHGAIR